MKICSRFQRKIAILLIFAIVMSMMSGCAHTTSSVSGTIQSTKADSIINTQAIAEQITNELVQNPDNSVIEAQPLKLSTNWEDYVGDMETFVYGLLIHQLEYKYDVFPAAVTLSNGTEIYGLGYTDYLDCFTNDDESITYFSAGMLPFCGEEKIPSKEFEKGLTIENLDYHDDQCGFLLKYAPEKFTEHCVAYGQYLKYGANSSGQISYSSEEYVRGNCDESLGSLYSYDEGRYVLDLDVGEYIPISGVSLASQIDFDLLEEEINKNLETQEINFAQVDIESNLYFAQEAVSSYLLSLQEETFLGYDVDVLIEATNNLDPMECLQISPDGILTIDIDDLPGKGATPLAKWLVGTTCVIATAVGLVASVICTTCPALSSAAGAVTGTAIDVFMQVVVSNKGLSDVDWDKVALAAVSGAVSGFLGPYIMAGTNGVGYFLADSTVDALMGGIEQTVSAWLDGEHGIEMAKSFGYGFAIGVALSAGFKGAGALIEALGKAGSSGLGKIANKIAPKLTSRISSSFSAVSNSIFTKVGNTFVKLQNVVNSTPFYSKYIANAISFRQLERLVDEGMDELAEKSFANLAKNGLVDVQGKPLTKDALKELFKNAKDGDTIATIVKGKDIINVVKKNGIVGIFFDPDQYITVNITRIVDDREANFLNAAEKIQSIWLDDPVSMPASISAAIRESGKSVQTIKPDELVKIFKTRSNGFVLHENIDMQTVTLVPRSLHDTIEGGFSHLGGFSLAKYVKSHMGATYFERFLAAASSGLVSAAN